MSKIVYLILSHTEPQQIVRLARILGENGEDSSIVIRHDYTNCPLDKSDFQQIPNLHLLPPIKSVDWGGISFVKAIVEAMKYIQANIDYDWLIVVSGQDYPISPVNEIEAFYHNSKYDAFMEGCVLDRGLTNRKELKEQLCPIDWMNEIFSRYYFYYYSLDWIKPKFLLKFKQAAKTSVNKRVFRDQKRVQGFNDVQSLLRLKGMNVNSLRLGIRRPFVVFTEGLYCYKGSDWFSLRGKCVDYIIDFVNNNPKFVRYYRHTYQPNESFFHTILFNNPDLLINTNYYRYIFWNDQYSPHPDVLRSADFENLVNSQNHFARKFDVNVDAEILNLLDNHFGWN